MQYMYQVCRVGNPISFAVYPYYRRLTLLVLSLY